MRVPGERSWIWARRLWTAAPGHDEVHDGDVGPGGGRQLDDLGHVGGAADQLQALAPLDHRLDSHAGQRIVVGDDDADEPGGGGRLRRGGRGGRAGPRLQLGPRGSGGQAQGLAHGRLDLGGGVGMAAGRGLAQLAAQRGDAHGAGLGCSLRKVGRDPLEQVEIADVDGAPHGRQDGEGSVREGGAELGGRGRSDARGRREQRSRGGAARGGKLARDAGRRDQSEPLAFGLQRLEAQRLGDVMVHARGQTHLAGQGGDRDHRRAVVQPVARADLAGGAVPVHGLGRAVHEDGDVRPLGGRPDRVGAVGDDVGGDAEVLEQAAGGKLADRVVVDDEDARFPPPLGVAARAARRGRRGRRGRRCLSVAHAQEPVTVERDHIITCFPFI
jgi:hypothetical protein